MNVEEERRRILELWERIRREVETTSFLGYLWEHKRELGELEARVERLEPKVIKLLEVIPTLRRHSPEYHAHCKHLVMLIHHIEPTEEWMQKIHDDLEFMSREIQKAKEAYVKNRIVASRTQTQARSVDMEKIDSLKTLINRIKKELEDLDKVALPFSRVAQEHYEVWQRGDVPPELESRFLREWRLTADECRKIIDSIPLFFDDLRGLLGSIFGFAPARRVWAVEDMSSNSAREEFAPDYENEVNHLPEQIRSSYLRIVDLLVPIWKESWSILHSSSAQQAYDQLLGIHAGSINKLKTEIYPQFEILESYFSR